MFATIIVNGYIRLVFTVVVAIVLLWILLKFNEKKNPQHNSLDLLEERYKRGEITKEDLEAAKRSQGKK